LSFTIRKKDSKYANVPMTRYPHPDSNLAKHVKLNVILSQAYRFRCLCSLRKDFLQALAELVNCFINKGYLLQDILHVTNRFFRFNVPLYGITSWSLLSKMLRKVISA